MRGRINQLLQRVTGSPTSSSSAPRIVESGRDQIAQYIAGGRLPWSVGYSKYKGRYIADAISKPETLELFRRGKPLPADYGFRLDERCVEFPWALSHLKDCGERVFDAGSSLNHAYLLEHEILKQRALAIYTLAPEWQLPRANISYLYGDLRSTILRDNSMNAATCISTLEHVGMNNTMLYTTDETFNECDLTTYKKVVEEIHRVLAPGGVALITVPFGMHENHGWTQQYDRSGVDEIIAAFGGRVEQLLFYRYWPTGWALATAEECADAKYFNIHATKDFDADHAAAARAVACMRLVK